MYETIHDAGVIQNDMTLWQICASYSNKDRNGDSDREIDRDGVEDGERRLRIIDFDRSIWVGDKDDEEYRDGMRALKAESRRVRYQLGF